MITTASIESTVTEGSVSTLAGKQPRARAAWFRRFVATLAAIIALTISASVLTAPAASAAPTTAYVTVCFQSSYDYKVFGTPWTWTVYYNLYNPSTGRWQVQQQYASATGCTRWLVYAGYYTYFQAYANFGSYYYDAKTPVYTYAAGQQYNLGSFRVLKYMVG